MSDEISSFTGYIRRWAIAARRPTKPTIYPESVSYSPSTKTWQDQIDSNLLRYIFANLFSNATNYSAGDSESSVEVDRNKGDITIRVIDHGIGFIRVDQKQMFELSFSASNTQNIDDTGIICPIRLSASQII